MANDAPLSGCPITVLVVDDHAVARVGLRTLLAAEPDLCIVGETDNATDALRLASELRPQIAIVDLLDGDAAGFGLIKDLRVQCETVRPLVCSAPLPGEMIRHLIAIGAAGYVCKDAPPEQILQAVRRVAAGKTYLDPDTAAELIANATRTPLTGSELEVLHLIGCGQDTHDIAAVLCRSPKTIETYRSRIKKKLRLKNTTVLAQTAWQFVHGVGTGGAANETVVGNEKKPCPSAA